MLIKIYFLLAALTASLFYPSQKQIADKIYYHAYIWTGDDSNPIASSIAIKGNKIIYVGDHYTDIKGANTEMIDLHGQMVVPGFMDNHTHFLIGGYSLASVELKPARTKEEFISMLKTYCLKHPGNDWIQGGDWNHEAWGGELPKKDWIDSVTGDHPIFITRYDGHMAFANSKAMALAGITKVSPTPAGGQIIKDADGEPTGIFKDEAMELINKVIPAPTQKEYDEYLERASQHAIENGVTEVHDVSSYGGWPELETYRKAYENKQLKLRIYAFVPLKDWKELNAYVKKNGWGDDMLHWGGLKGFVDGSLGSTTAWFYQPYLDAPNSYGLQITDTTLLRKWVLEADSANLHVTVHAIGDRANDFILSVYEQAGKMNGKKDRRFRVEHAQHLTEKAIKRFHELNVIPSMQSYHLVDDGVWAAKRLDKKRLERTYVFKSLLDNGAKVTFGSDWTVAPLNPILGIYAAVTRQTGDNKNPKGWFPEQKLTVEQALKCYTVNNAYAGFQENKLGKLKKGMLADFTVLSKNLFRIPPEKIKDVKVTLTVVDGKEVFRKE
jgi:predicted amidohydrolase YtcJ